jgi:hypothetical protein
MNSSNVNSTGFFGFTIANKFFNVYSGIMILLIFSISVTSETSRVARNLKLKKVIDT